MLATKGKIKKEEIMLVLSYLSETAMKDMKVKR